MTGGSILGGILSGLGQAQQQNKITGEQKREFNLQTQLQQQQAANQYGRQLQMSPLRSQAIAQLMNRMGMSPTSFNPLNYGSGNNQAPSQGGVNLNALAQQNASPATAQAAQQNRSQIDAINQSFLGQLGYGSGQQLQHQVNSGDLGQGYGYSLGLPGANNGTGWNGMYGDQGLPSNMGPSWTPQGGSLGQGIAFHPQSPGQLNPTSNLYSPNGRQMTSPPSNYFQQQQQGPPVYKPANQQFGSGTSGAVGGYPKTGASPQYFNSLQSY